ncbi:hypothetical protein GO755_01645 [Spirosoma sp. HMF4905]|uniref:Glycosyltransferase RgtA/B/C/D-like domain-containing protein n=1 Tax=Spirosoma arboris TaxID=2682092 RepID=A0A7K1S546_9BACT|nr:hypothetical protein [Spirosoma arboris]MVM28718.1 hypothetical protein [Spirosoma arboris]
MTYKSRSLQRIAPILILLPISCFWAFLFAYAADIPWMDDMESFIYFQVKFLRAESILTKLEWLLKPNNEHRILFAKLVAAGMQALTGSVNFRWLILIASIWLVGIIFILYRVFRTIRVPLVAFLPVVLLLLHPQYYLITLSAVTSFQHQTTVALLFAVAYLLAKPGTGRLSGALGLQILASFSMSSGLFGWVSGAGTLLVQRRFKEAIVWIGIGVVIIVLYVRGFANSQGNDTSISFFLQHPHLVFLGFFTFSGALLDFFPSAPILPRSILPTLAGFGLIGVLLWMLKRMLLPWPAASTQPDARSVRRNFLVGAYGFILINAVLIAFLRPRFGYSVMLISNYTMYSSLLAILLYLNGLSEFSRWDIQRKWITVGLCLGLIVWSAMYFQSWTRVAERKQMFEAFSFNQKHNGVGLGATLGTPFAPAAKWWMDSAVAIGFYQYPRAFYTPYEQDLLKPAVGQPTTSINLLIDEQPDYFSVQTEGWQVPEHLSNACFIAKSPERTYLFPVPTLFNPTSFFLGRKVPVLRAQLLKTSLYPGTYQLGILLSPVSGPAIQYLKQHITVR